MASFNKVILLGNLTRDPEVRYTPKGSAVCDLGIAVNRVYTTEGGERREEVTFVDVVLWARLAEIAGEYLKKGRPIFIEGRLQMDSWDDKQTGQKRTKLRVVGERKPVSRSTCCQQLGLYGCKGCWKYSKSRNKSWVRNATNFEKSKESAAKLPIKLVTGNRL
jgi:single stranded DNA-binding protein